MDMNSYVYFMEKKSKLGRKNPEETRRKIVEATVALHEEVGPASTTVSAVAARAGVQRLTVYRHLPDEEALIQACSAHWSQDHPLPDSSEWAGLEDALQRLSRALGAVYAYYRDGESMLEKVLRDEEKVPALRGVMVPFHAWFRELAGQLSAGWGRGSAVQPRIRAAVGHALRFETWQSLTGEGLSDREAAEMMARFVECVSGQSPT